MKPYKSFLLATIFLLISVVLFACTNTPEYSLEFDSNGGSNVTSLITNGKTIVLPNNPIKEGYTFDGWYWDNDTFLVPLNTDSIAEEYISSVMVVYAKWALITNPEQFSINFDSMGGSPVETIVAPYQSTIQPPIDPTMDGFVVFEGWYTDSEYTTPYTFTIMPEQDLTLYAKWTNSLILTTDPIEITLWHAEKSTNQAYLQAYADAFMVLYPNITVHIPTGVNNYDRVKQDVLSAVSGNYQLPNLVQGTPEHMAEYVYHDILLNLNPFVNNPDWGFNESDALDDIIASFRDECSQYDADGSYYALPFAKTTEIMIYNKTAIDSIGLYAPQVWQDMQSFDALLKIYGSQFNNENEIITATYESTSNMFSTFAKQYHGAYTSLDFETMTGQNLWVNNNNTLAAMNYLKNNNAYLTIPQFWDENYASTPFIEQKTFMIISSSSDFRYNVPPINPLTGLPAFEVGVAPIPYNGEVLESQAVIQRGTDMGLLKTGTIQQQLASWLFLKYITNTENTADWSIKTNYLPVRTSAYESAIYQEFLNNPTVSQLNNSLVANAIYQQVDYMFFEPAFMYASLVRTKVGTALERIILGDGDIEEALEEANS